MRNCVAIVLVAAFAMSSAVFAADDWTFVVGTYAVTANDCKLLAKRRPFSKELVKDLNSEVLTREGITSMRETHCRFRSSKRETGATPRWTVKAQCEEMGAASANLDVISVTARPDGTLVIKSEDVFGPEPLTFVRCPK